MDKKKKMMNRIVMSTIPKRFSNKNLVMVRHQPCW